MARVDDIMQLLKSQIKLVLPSFVLTQGSDSGNPTLKVEADATPATGEENAFIRLTQKSYSGFPTISLASSVDGRPDLLQIAVEADATTAARSVWSEANWAKLLVEAAKMNVEIELYIRATGAAPAVGDIIDANLRARILADARHPNVGM